VEVGRIAGGNERREGATIAYRLENATVAHGVVYAGGASRIHRTDGPRFLLSGQAARREAGLIASSRTGELFFGDWLVEAFSLALVAETMSVPAIGFERREWPHEAGYRALFSLAIDPVRHVRFDTLWIVDDRGINDGRGARFRELRRRLRASTTSAQAGERVYLARGTTGQARTMTNQDDVEAQLAARGFAIVHPERETPRSLAAKLVDARIVVVMEGSAQTHALLAMADGGAVIVLQPPNRFTAPGKDMADMAGLRYGFIVGDPAGDGFSIDPQRLDETIALVDASI
jgi:capsular polysaccharide biosynthesis protein